MANTMTAFDTALDWIGRKVGHRLQREEQGLEPFVPSDAEALRRTLRPADVLLVAGGNKLSTERVICRQAAMNALQIQGARALLPVEIHDLQS